MPQEWKETQALLLESMEISPVDVEGGPDNLWAMTLKSGEDERVYALTSDHLRQMAEEILKKVSS